MNLFDELREFYNNFPYEKGVIGYTFTGKPIFYFKVEKSDSPVVIIQYAIHGREYITTYLSLLQIKEYIYSGKKGRVYFIPLTNPDGVDIALNVDPLYKANGRGVDLNVNFDARWGTGSKNTTVIGRENYIGEHPFSENESKALKDFTLLIRPDITVSYHSKGEEIYYRFFQDKYRLKRDYYIAKKVAKVTGYAVKETPFSAGGYKDWCIEKLKIPALTIEVGDDRLFHPIGKEHAGEIFEKNRQVVKVLTELKWKKDLWN